MSVERALVENGFEFEGAAFDGSSRPSKGTYRALEIRLEDREICANQNEAGGL